VAPLSLKKMAWRAPWGALCGHAIGDRETSRRSLVVACGWSLITSLGGRLKQRDL